MLRQSFGITVKEPNLSCPRFALQNGGSESFCCIIAGAALWARPSKTKVLWSRSKGSWCEGGRQTLLALRIMKQRNRRIHLRVWTKNPGWEYGFLGSRNRVKEKFQLPNAKRIRRDERHSLLGIYISALPAATQSCFPSIFFYDYFSFIFH